MKKELIIKQKKLITEMNQAGVYLNAHEENICMLNLMVDDLELRGNVIDRYNIHLYYSLMSPNEISKLSYKVFWNKERDISIFMERSHQITQRLGIPFRGCSLYYELETTDFEDIQLYINGTNKKDYTPYRSLKAISGLYSFGIKDTLDSIDLYIKNIKKSSRYKDYISSKEKDL